MFSAIRVFVGGQLCEDFQELPPLASMMSRFKPAWRQIQDSMENHPISPVDGSRLALAAGESRRLIISLPCGLLRQQKWLPLHLLSNMVLEMTLGPADLAFNEATPNFELHSVSVLCTCLHVDSSVTAQYHAHIDSGNKLTIPYQSVVGSRHIVNSSDFTISLSRSLSRLKQLFFVLVKDGEKIATQHKQPVNQTQLDLRTDTMQFQIQIGSEKYPDNACIGVAESFHRLKQAVGHQKDHDDFGIIPSKFMGSEAVFGIDFERAGNEALFTGISTRDSKVMTLHVRGSQVSATNVHTCFVYQVYDGILNIRRMAVDVED